MMRRNNLDEAKSNVDEHVKKAMGSGEMAEDVQIVPDIRKLGSSKESDKSLFAVVYQVTQKEAVQS